MTMRECATARVAASPETVFDLVTDPSRLPTWDRAITEVVETPEHLDRGQCGRSDFTPFRRLG
jgi:uncharacterized protein YndB with AHSA1/START domain